MFHTHGLICEKSFGFQVEKGKEEDKGEKRKIRKEIFVFPFIL